MATIKDTVFTGVSTLLTYPKSNPGGGYLAPSGISFFPVEVCRLANRIVAPLFC